MRFIITGTNGFIGKSLLNKLKDKNTCTEINEDIFQKNNWVSYLNEVLDDTLPDAIFHVGVCSDITNTDINYMMIRNYEFTRIISDYCGIKDVPLIYSSSASNYGINNLYPTNLYGWSKYVAEQSVIQNGGIALRYFNVYGPGEGIKPFSSNLKGDFVYIDDVVDANIYAYENYYEFHFKFYEVGSGELNSFEDVMILLGIDNVDRIGTPKEYQFNLQSDSDKWMNKWQPQYNLERGLQDYSSKISIK